MSLASNFRLLRPSGVVHNFSFPGTDTVEVPTRYLDESDQHRLLYQVALHKKDARDSAMFKDWSKFVLLSISKSHKGSMSDPKPNSLILEKSERLIK